VAGVFLIEIGGRFFLNEFMNASEFQSEKEREAAMEYGESGGSEVCTSFPSPQH
jgi:hypothetical protein